jgi:hypothetical protein
MDYRARTRLIFRLAVRVFPPALPERTEDKQVHQSIRSPPHPFVKIRVRRFFVSWNPATGAESVA